MNTLMVLALVATQSAEPDPVRVSAHVDSDELVVGSEYEIVLDLSLAESLSTSGAGIPAPILQIDVPSSVSLSGRHLKSYPELASNEFLMEPFERLVRELPARIRFRLNSPPGADETFGLNLLSYVSDEKADFFSRRRLELPLKPRAIASEGDPRNSSWSDDGKALRIGEPAVEFTLPRADGSEFALESVLGRKNVIVTTYRAYW